MPCASVIIIMMTKMRFILMSEYGLRSNHHIEMKYFFSLICFCANLAHPQSFSSRSIFLFALNRWHEINSFLKMDVKLEIALTIGSTNPTINESSSFLSSSMVQSNNKEIIFNGHLFHFGFIRFSCYY